MLKYNDLISKLTDEQKIRILTGVGDISGKDMKILGVSITLLPLPAMYGCVVWTENVRTKNFPLLKVKTVIPYGLMPRPIIISANKTAVSMSIRLISTMANPCR